MKKNYQFRKNNKNTLEVLIESEKNGKYVGLDQYFNQIEVNSTADLVGDWIFIDDYEARQDKNVAEFK